jgi:hypothetical protein
MIAQKRPAAPSSKRTAGGKRREWVRVLEFIAGLIRQTGKACVHRNGYGLLKIGDPYAQVPRRERARRLPHSQVVRRLAAP